MSKNLQDVLLPKDFKPLNYNLSLKVDLDNFNFNGKEIITLSILQESSEITLHSLDLLIDKESIQMGEQKCQDLVYDQAKQTVKLIFSSKFSGEKVNLSFNFSGKLNEKMSGFYKSSYKINDETRYMGVTQFEPTDARRAFPCFDEPNLKATFEISLTIPKDRIGLSNMPSISEEIHQDGYKKITFEKSPIMSTYLVAYIVGEFDYLEDTTSDGIKVRVFTPVGKKELGNFALFGATKALSYFNEFFGISYPLPKMDLVGIGDFAAGAMENWGLVTYRETRLLIDSKNSSSSTKEATMRTISHEIAHSWFGNLVTMQWWTHLWLNEGFARFIEHLAVDHLFKEWDIWTQFVSNVYSVALNLDSLKSTHAIEIPVGHPDEINEIFDSISYAKGGSILRMLSDFIGIDNLKKGLYEYLTKFKYSNAVTEDLWECLQMFSDQPIQKIMDTWTKQEGYPVIHVKEVSTENGKKTLEFSQNRFLLSGESKDHSIWKIPIKIKTKTEKYFLLMEDIKVQFTIKDDGWYKINSEQTGFYRVHYESYKQLSNIITDLSPSDRIGLICDAFALTRAGILTSYEFLDFLQYFKKETHYSVLSEISSCIGYINNIIEKENFYPKFQSFVCELFEPSLNRLGWDSKDGENHLDVLLRSTTLSRMISMDHKPSIETAFSKFQDRKLLTADQRSLVYCTVVKRGGEKEYLEMKKIFEESTLNEEKRRAIVAMCCTQDEKLIQETLEYSLNEKNVKPQDFSAPIDALNANKKAKDICWKFIKENWKTIASRYEGSGFVLQNVVNSACSRWSTFEMAKEIEEFFEKNPTPSAKRNILQCIERTKNNAIFYEREIKYFEKFFKN